MPVVAVLPHAVNRLQPSVNLSDQGGCAIAEIQDSAAGRANDAYGLRVSRFVEGEGVLIGEFKLKDGRTAVLVHNHNWDVSGGRIAALDASVCCCIPGDLIDDSEIAIDAVDAMAHARRCTWPRLAGRDRGDGGHRARDGTAR